MIGMNPEDLNFMLPQGAAQAANPLGGASASPAATASGGGVLSSLFSSGGILERMADAQNPMLKDSGLPLWAKALMTSKFGAFKGGNAFGMDFTGMGDLAKDAKAQEVLDKYFNEMSGAGAGGTAPTVMRNESTTTTPVSRAVQPRRISEESGLPMASELLEQLMGQPTGGRWRV